MMKAFKATILLAGVVGGGAHGYGDGDHPGQSLCPKDPDVSPECTAAIYPPFPICLKKTAKEWIAHAKDASARCCGDNIDECKCPAKDSPAFQGKIGVYCSAVKEGGACEATDGGGGGGHDHDRPGQVLCPKDPDVSAACTDAIYPPFPICLKKTAKEWVAYAKDASTRCCGENTDACTCPKKNTPAFQGSIGGFCAAVKDGGACTTKGPGAGMEGNGLLRGFDREQQVQREELAP